MKGGFRQSMGWLHIWGGLVAGWLLYFMFVTGSAGYFDVEIDRWMQPERPLAQAARTSDAALDRALGRLRTVAPGAERWFLGLPGERVPGLLVFWRLAPGPDGTPGASGSETLDPATGGPVVHRETGGGQLLYRMHYDLHYLPSLAANWIVGVATMLMLVAIVTGVIVHRRIFRDFFTFRAGKGQRSWLDAHNLLSVLALPFHLMITWSGLVFFAYLYMAPIVWASYGTGESARAAYFAELFGRDDRPSRAGVPAPLVPLEPLLRQAEARAGRGEARYVDVYAPGDAKARIVVAVGPQTPSRSLHEFTFDGTTGTPLGVRDGGSAPFTLYQTLLGLHEGLFAGPLLRWLYFLTGLAGAGMIAAGLVHWTAKRRAAIGATRGFRLVEGLNVATVAGLPVAIAAYFWANRLVPVGLDGRAAWEAHAMFAVWAVLLLHAFLRPAGRAWAEQCRLVAAAFGLLPLLNALTTDRHLGVTLPAGVWDLAGFDLTMLAFGIGFALVARRLGHGRRAGVAGPARAASGSGQPAA